MLSELNVLKTVWPSECNVVGDDTLRVLARSQVGEAQEELVLDIPRGGSHFDILPLLQLLTAALALIRVVLQVYADKQKETTKAPSETEVFLESKKLLPDSELPEPVASKRDAVIKAVQQGPVGNDGPSV